MLMSGNLLDDDGSMELEANLPLGISRASDMSHGKGGVLSHSNRSQGFATSPKGSLDPMIQNRTLSDGRATGAEYD